MVNKKSCAIVGPLPLRFAWGFDEEDDVCAIFKRVLLQHIQRSHSEGISDFLVACDPGVGLWSAEIINLLREKAFDMRLYCHTPHEGQATKWPPYLRERYFTMLEKCTYITVEHTEAVPSAQADAFRTIIHNSDMTLAVYDEKTFERDAVHAALEQIYSDKKPSFLIHPDTFEATSIFV